MITLSERTGQEGVRFKRQMTKGFVPFQVPDKVRCPFSSNKVSLPVVDDPIMVIRADARDGSSEE